MQEEIFPKVSRAAKLFGKIPDTGKKLIEAYGMGFIHGSQIEKDKHLKAEDEKDSA